MKNYISKFKYRFFRKELELQVKLFNVLAIAGAVNCFIMCVLSIVHGQLSGIITNAGIAVLSVGLLVYSEKSQKYQACYLVTIVIIFFIMFPVLFFTGGGYHSGMPLFFIFAVVYTSYMIEGKMMIFVVLLELIFYGALGGIAYIFPELVTPLKNERAVLNDIMTSFFTVSTALAVTMYVQFRMYKRQQMELEVASREAETANKAKSAFLANMSHEVRTPIHIILGMNEIIRRESKAGHILQCSDRIDEASKMLLSLVDSVLDVSKIESGKMEVIPDVYEVSELVNVLTLIGKTRCSKKKLSFQSVIDESIPENLYGDLAHIRQIAGNLLSNAAKYTEHGGVILKIGCRPGKEENTIILCISVKDTGIGIKKEAVNNLFDAFIREDLASHRYIEGTGLGLAIVKALTSLMDGTITVESEYGVGSEFRVEIPQIVCKSGKNEKDLQKKDFLAPLGKILIVDDNESNRFVMKQLLATTLMHVDTAASGRECIKMVRENSYHIILMDYMMPEMDGKETLKALEKIPGFSVPVIALTANAALGTERNLLDAGFKAFVMKPVPWGKLQEVLVDNLPEDIVEVVDDQNKVHEVPGINLEEYSKCLLKYGLVLDSALLYFGGDIVSCGNTARLFLKYYEKESRKLNELYLHKDYENMRFLVHAVKGKAKNMGLEQLFELAAYIEKLCSEGKNDEIDSLIPYMMYVWKKGKDGLEMLDEITRDQKKKTEKEVVSETDEKNNVEELKRMLHQLRRKPAMECIERMMARAEEKDKPQLESIREHVASFEFEEAMAQFEKMLKQEKRDENEL